jgi:ferredoxin
MLSSLQMATVALTVLPDGRALDVEGGTTILGAAHAAGIDITATCGGRGRCTSCRVKFVAGAPPPPTVMDELQLGAALVRDGYRLSCQCRLVEPVTVALAPPLDERSFQILGAQPAAAALDRVTIEAGIRKEVVQVALPKEEHHQTSDLEELLRATGRRVEDVPTEVVRGLPQALRAGSASRSTSAPPAWCPPSWSSSRASSSLPSRA